ncbi:cytochrome c class I [Anoxybacillus flavithermus]|uniref:Cytochrome c class I n=2 Tax=Anoxybacillus TaxID=150247 RepID=A0A2G5RQW7_9BACL|nr:cytochrome ubiquinol oxidase subunit I [Anoxybacillus flavithermus]PIC05248.1 cytochrome c class I [Anoxybacillus flavithermus]
MHILQLAIPPDFPLPIPGNLSLLEFLIVLTFILHIVFVNFTLSFATGAVALEGAGIVKKSKRLDDMARICSFHASIHKSIAVVLGVAPLLIVSVIYTQYFYTSTLLIGKAWISIIVLLITAFLLLYVYKFSWEKWENKKGLHFFVGLVASAILLFIPLIFIVNIVSMLYPEKWSSANGFFHSLFYYPQIWQRYAHFVLASLAAGGFYMYFYFAWKQKKQPLSDVEQSLKMGGVKVTFWITLLQLLFGSLLLISFRRDIVLLFMGDDLLLTVLLLVSILLTIVLCGLLYIVTKKDTQNVFYASVICFVLIVALMGWMRHEVRESYLQPYMDEHPRTLDVQKENVQPIK